MPITRRDFARAPPRWRSPPRSSALRAAALRRPRMAENVPVAELMKPEALPDMALGGEKAPVTIVEYASMTCPHCAHFEETDVPGDQEALHRHRQGSLYPARLPARQPGGRGFRAGALRVQGRRRKIFFHGGDAVPPAAQWAVEKPVPPLLAIAKQAGLHREVFRRLPVESEGLGCHRKRASARHRRVQGQVDADFLHQWDERHGALSIEELAKVIDPYLKGG